MCKQLQLHILKHKETAGYEQGLSLPARQPHDPWSQQVITSGNSRPARCITTSQVTFIRQKLQLPEEAQGSVASWTGTRDKWRRPESIGVLIGQLAQALGPLQTFQISPGVYLPYQDGLLTHRGMASHTQETFPCLSVSFHSSIEQKTKLPRI